MLTIITINHRQKYYYYYFAEEKKYQSNQEINDSDNATPGCSKAKDEITAIIEEFDVECTSTAAKNEPIPSTSATPSEETSNKSPTVSPCTTPQASSIAATAAEEQSKVNANSSSESCTEDGDDSVPACSANANDSSDFTATEKAKSKLNCPKYNLNLLESTINELFVIIEKIS